MNPVPTPPDLRALTTVRFLAAAWVVLFAAWPHLAGVTGTPTFVEKGYLGVEVFFVLSGFILSHVYLEAAGQGGYSHKGFLWARIARVYPLHLLTLAGMAALGVAAGVAGMAADASLSDWCALPAHLTMTHAWGLAPSAAFNHPSWSISAEWLAYLTFPAFAFVAWRLRDRPQAAVLMTATAALLIYAVFEWVSGQPLTLATFRWGALRIVPCFALGCALYLVHRRGGVRRPALVAGVSGLALIVVALLGLWDPLVVLAAGGLILGLGSLDNARAGVLASPAGVYLGEVSYAVYMLCAPVLLIGTHVAAKLLGGADGKLHILVWLAVIAAILPAAMAAHHLVERPARKALRDLAARKGRAGPATKTRTQLV